MKTHLITAMLLTQILLFATPIPEINIVASPLCKGSPTLFSLSPNVAGSEVTWNFGDGQTATGPAPLHLYSNAGNYNVTATIITSGYNIVRRKLITVSATPVIAAPVHSRNLCTTGSIQYALSQNDAVLLGSQESSTYGVAYFSSLANLTAHTNPVVSVSYGSTMVYAKVFNRSNSTCYSSTSFQVSIFRSPDITQPPPLTLCDFNNDGIELFNLTNQTPLILGAQSASEYLVSYFSNQDDATMGEHPLSGQFANTGNPQIIFARIENRLNRSCCRTISFELRLVRSVGCVMRE